MTENLSARCCIAGGGPAGMMLGFLLARAGVDVVVLEKHADFLRDFRGDTIHPSTLEVIQELGLLDQLLILPHEKVRQLNVQVGNTRLTLADFTRLPTRCGFIAFMPQWDFLDFLAEHARRYAAFRLSMEIEVIGVIEECLKLCVDYAKSRKLWGQEIAQFQLIQLKLANMEVARINVRNMLFRVIEAAQTGSAISLPEASAIRS